MQLPKLSQLKRGRTENGSDQVVRQIHRNLSFLVVGEIVLAAFVLGNLYRNGIIGPIQSGNPPPILVWSVSDHTGSGAPLANQINGSDVPRYDDNRVLDLQRDANGNLVALPRIQATLEYHKP